MTDKSTKSEAKDSSHSQSNTTISKRGRPKKVRSAQELAKIEKEKKNKLTLAEKQAIKLKQQKERQAKKAESGELEPKNRERFYCTNKELQAELIKWRDSAEKVEDRSPSEELGRMILAIGNKLLNHSSFKNYTKELKEDMLLLYCEKLLKGLKNYNFAFNNPFAFFTQAAWNSFLIVIGKHYKHINIKKDLMKKLSQELETYAGISANSALNKCIKSYLGNDVELD